ncbi:MAG: FUSC family protein [Sarcina sp.]
MINKASVIKALIVFVIVAIFMYLSGLILGGNNSVMGLLIVLSVLMLLGKDLTGNPYRNIVKLSVLGVGSVICAYLASINIFLGLIVNLIWVFIIIYVNIFNLKIPMYYSFLLTYLMLLVLKTDGHEIIPRSLALIFTSILVVGIQVIIRKKKLKKNKRPNLLKSLRVLDKELDNIVNSKEINEEKQQFTESMKVWNSNLLERRQNNFYFTAKENRQSITMANLEKLQKEILELKKLYKKDESYGVVLVSLRLVINEVIKSITHNATPKDVEERLNQYLENSKEKINNYHVYTISETMKNLLDLVKDRKFETEDSQILKERPTLIRLIKYSFNRDSLRFTFAVRMAVLIAITYFVVTGLKLEYGKWILFTLMAVCQPYDTTTEKMGKNRIVGTVIGALVVFIVFTIIQSMAIRIGILGIGFYMFIAADKPIIKGVGTTMFALSISELTVKAGFATMIITADRVMYTVIGFIIAILGSKIILHYDIRRETKNLIEKYYRIIDENARALMDIKDIKDTTLKLRASMILTKSIESKIIINNTVLKNSGIENYIETSRNVMIGIYSSLQRLRKVTNSEDLKNIEKKLSDVYNKFDTRFESTIVERIDDDFVVNEKSALYVSLAEVIESLANTRYAKAEITL